MPRTASASVSEPAAQALGLVASLPHGELRRYLDGIRELLNTEPEPAAQRPRREQAVTFRLRVDLLDAKPPIWRRLLVPSDINLTTLHRVIQTSMGWSGGNLHQFTKGTNRSDPKAERFVARPEFVAPGASLESDVRLDQLLADKGDKLFYDHDLRGAWQHQIKLEAIEPVLSGQPQYRCIGGRRACPPEECGGMDAYRELVALTKVPADELDEVGMGRLRYHTFEGWSPDAFDLAATNEALKQAA